MMFEVRVPAVGESITEGVLARWFKRTGDLVRADEALFDLETDKITVNATAEKAGRVTVLAAEGVTVAVGQVVATIDTDAAAQPAADAAPARGSTSPGPAPGAATAPQAPVAQAGLDALAPAVRRLVVGNNLDPASITATGPHGRLLKEDVVRAIEARGAAPAAAPAVPAPAAPGTPASEAPGAGVGEASRARAGQTRTRISPIRARIAQRLLQAQNNAAILTTFNEADMGRLIDLRARLKEPFRREHGVSLGYVSFFARAVVAALREVPVVAAWIEGDELVRSDAIDLGVAVSSPRGLVVPVVRDCDRLSLVEIERRLADLAARAQTGALQLAELQGGVFTISNGGVFGSLLSTPILNPPQSGILGLHAIKKRAVVVDDAVVARPMMYLALSYDHRVVDGAEAVTFLRAVVRAVEDPETLV